MQRRSFLRLALSGVVGATVGVPLSGCGAGSPSEGPADPDRGSGPAQAGGGRILLAYFSRPGENYWYGGRRNLNVGNTEVLARMVSARLDCDLHRIEAVDTYPADYEDTVRRNVREQQADARPAIANPLPSIDGYDTILLASPIWNVRAPMIMSTFVENYDFSGKTVHPVTTYAMSGLGTTPMTTRARAEARASAQDSRFAVKRSGPPARPSNRGCAAPPCSTLGNVPASEPGSRAASRCSAP
jgi:flavodoxin